MVSLSFSGQADAIHMAQHSQKRLTPPQTEIYVSWTSLITLSNQIRPVKSKSDSYKQDFFSGKIEGSLFYTYTLIEAAHKKTFSDKFECCYAHTAEVYFKKSTIGMQ